MNKAKPSPQRQGATGPTRWDAQWRKQYARLMKFHDRHGRWPKITEEFPAGNRIGQWASRQRELRLQGTLDAWRVRLLREAGFSWKKADERASHWNGQYGNLLEFRKRHPDAWPYARQDFPKGNRLGLWVWRQRQAFAYRSLPPGRKRLLEKIRFPFELPDSWEAHCETLKAYRSRNPNRWPKAREEFPAGNRLGLWCHLQRCAYKAGKLLPARAAKLEKLGFQWSVKQVSWMRFHDLLKAYKQAHPGKWPMLEAVVLEDRRLIAWCSTQRHKRRTGKLDKDKIAALDKLGFRW